MARPAKKKDDIERSALELFVEKGVDGTSIRDIALRAGVTEGALYRHHQSKDDLVRALFFASYESFATMMTEIKSRDHEFPQLIEHLVKSFFTIYDEDPYVFEFVMLVRHRLLDEVRADERNPVELLFRFLEEARRKNEIPKQDLALTTQMILGIVLQVAVAARYQRVKKPLSLYVRPVANAILDVCGASTVES